HDRLPLGAGQRSHQLIQPRLVQERAEQRIRFLMQNGAMSHTGNILRCFLREYSWKLGLPAGHRFFRPDRRACRPNPRRDYGRMLVQPSFRPTATSTPAPRDGSSPSFRPSGDQMALPPAERSPPDDPPKLANATSMPWSSARWRRFAVAAAYSDGITKAPVRYVVAPRSAAARACSARLPSAQIATTAVPRDSATSGARTPAVKMPGSGGGSSPSTRASSVKLPRRRLVWTSTSGAAACASSRCCVTLAVTSLAAGT